MKELLGQLSRNSITGVATGVVVTGISNSLTLVSVLLVGFVAGDLMPFERCIPVLMGAGVGSTFIGLLVVFKVTKYGLAMVALGFGFQFVRKKPSGLHGTEERIAKWEARNHCATIVFGLGLIFHGSELMGGAFGFLKTSDSFLAFLASLTHPVLGCLSGLLLTGLVQSSGAALGIFLNLAQQGLLGPQAGIAMTLGANVGTCITAILAALGQGDGPMRVAVALTAARAVGAAVCCCYIWPLEYASYRIVGVTMHSKLSNDDTASVIAASHTIFNLMLCVVVVPFSDTYARGIKRLVPSKADKADRDLGHSSPGIEPKTGDKAMHAALGGDDIEMAMRQSKVKRSTIL